MNIQKFSEFIDTPIKQYFAGLLLNLLLITLLLSNSATRFNVWAPTGDFSRNIWEKSDVLTYLEPAISFIDKGSFNNGNLPDFHRTIGYPFFLSIFKRLLI